MSKLARRTVLAGALGLAAPAWAAGDGERLAAAARRQVGVTVGYDPAYRRLGYPEGDVPRSTGVCADVVIRAARDALGLDLQRLVHEDMRRAFASYPSRRAWGLARPDPNIDHRRVLNLETYWSRQGARLWQADGFLLAPAIPVSLAPGDMLSFRLLTGQPHVAVVVAGGILPRVVHNIGSGAEEALLASLTYCRAAGHYRWPKRAGSQAA